MEIRRVTAQKGTVTLAVYEWPGVGAVGSAGDAPVVLLSHGTGFHGRCWDEVMPVMCNYNRLIISVYNHVYKR